MARRPADPFGFANAINWDVIAALDEAEIAAHEAEIAAQWAEVEAGEQHLLDTDPERTR